MDIAVEYAQKCGRKNGVVVVVVRSDLNDSKRTPRVMLGCERSGGYRRRVNDRKRRSATKKCNCPFSLKAYVTDTVTKRWGLVVMNGIHNHTLVKSFEGHAFVGRLSREEKQTVERLSSTGMRTRDILHHLKMKDPTNVTTLKTIYNFRSATKIKESAGRGHMQQLFKLLVQNGYVVNHRVEAKTEEVKDLFFSCSTSIELAGAFPFVFMLDCTYKTNKYCLPLLQIVGVTSTMKTFCIAFCYMSSEKEENYEWALRCFRDLFDALWTSVFIVVLLISKEQCLSFLPLRDPVPKQYNQNMLVFGYLNGSHFVRMELTPDSPIPPVSKMWTENRFEAAAAWSKSLHPELINSSCLHLQIEGTQPLLIYVTQFRVI